MQSLKSRWRIEQGAYLVLLFCLPTLVQAEPWSVHQRNIRAYEKKIETHQNAVRDLIQKKKTLKDPKELQATVKSMVEEHGKLKAEIGKRDKEIKHMRFRHPEKGQEFDHKYYKTYRFKTLAEYEDENDLPAKLTRLHQKIKRHFGVKPEDEAEEIRRRSILDGDVEESIRLVK